MARKNVHQLAYTAIRIEGGLIPAEELTRLTTLQAPDATQQTEAHYQIPKGLKLRDEIARNFKIAQNLWQDFQAQRHRTGVDAHKTTVRDFLLPLLRQAMGYTDLAPAAAIQASNSAHHSYQIGHAALAGRLPVVLAGHDQPLDQAAERFGDTNPDTGRTRRRSPYMLAQEALNATDRSLWAIVSNGLTLRILRDNPSLTRPAYVEVDLEALFTEELYADFTAFWLLAHASRFGLAEAEPADCPWERWRNAGQAVGVTARLNLRYQVAEALRSLGTGFLRHPTNADLRAVLQDAEHGSATKQRFFEELLSLVYRFIFLATVEDRGDASSGRSLIFTPEATDAAQARYWAGYSLTWLRERAVRRSSHDAHSDLWQALSITFDGLATGQPALGLPALGGLFAAEQCPLLNACQLENRHLLAAVFQLGYFRQATGLTRVNYRDMGAEELGSVYESLLELVPDIQHLTQPHVVRLGFVGDEDDSSNKGNARKLTGSYYTPDSLVQELVKSALEPVLAQAIQDHPTNPVDAVLQLTVCDPACGSGHFLLAAARRMADEVAKLRTQADGGAPTPADYRHALRDVVSHCIYGVDKNPMAIALAKTALWLEAYTPDKPLTFIDHHLQVGDALLGVLDPKILENGIPDAAYAVLSGDDKAVASALKKQNKLDLKSWKQVVANDLFAATTLVQDADAVEHLDDDTLDSIAAKRSAWSEANQQAQRSTLAKLADTYVAAFLAPKVSDGQLRIPLSGYLWGLMHPNPNQTASADTAQAAHDLCRTYGVFHWWLAFPQVAAKGGFGVMLGNPPWERIKLQEEEFFATRSPLVAVAKNKAERAKRIELLRQGVLLHTLYPDVEAAEGLSPPNRAEMRLHEEFIAARRGAEAASLYAHDSGRYPLTGVGDVNTYALFAESLFQLTAPGGRAGFIVPTGIATDDTTKAYFERLAVGGFLRSLLCLENEEFVFPSVHHAFRFALLTLSGQPSGEPATLVFFARQPEQIHDPRRRFALTPDEFSLINPNTRTCPVFRSERDAELTKKIYRTAPVLITEAPGGDEGTVVKTERNPWGVRFQAMFHMSGDSPLFADAPAQAGQHQRLPLYEAKMIHQFDHRWATYVDAESGTPGEVETADVSDTLKADPTFAAQPRYWVEEREVLARIARVPSRVARAWLALYAALDMHSSVDQKIALDGAHTDLRLSLAQWVAGELFYTAAAPAPTADGWTAQQAQRYIATVEQQLQSRFPKLDSVLRGDGMTTKKALSDFPKWAQQNRDCRLDTVEMSELAKACQSADTPLRLLLDQWMDHRSPRWLMGWRDITGVEKIRTLISSVVPRSAVGDKFLLMRPSTSAPLCAALLGNLDSLVCDFVARQKVGGTSFKYFTMKQIAVLPPESYTSIDLAFIVPRVLELTYTANDLEPWGKDLVAYDPRPTSEQNQPFTWSPERRAQLRAELDAYYGRLYGLDRDELRYILDPSDVMGLDYPSETFRVLQKYEMRVFGEYRTQRLVLKAWDELDAGGLVHRALASSSAPKYSEQSVIRNPQEAEFAGLLISLVQASPLGISVEAIQDVVAHASMATAYLEPAEASRLNSLVAKTEVLGRSSALNLVLPFVQRLEVAGAVQRKRAGASSIFMIGVGAMPPDVSCQPEHAEMARLMLKLEALRAGSKAVSAPDDGLGHQAQGGG